jgi:hypothetical protein
MANHFWNRARQTRILDWPDVASALNDHNRVGVALGSPPPEVPPGNVNCLVFAPEVCLDRFSLFEKAAEFLILALANPRGGYDPHLFFPRVQVGIGR